MKKLEELGISPAPWSARMDFWIDDANGDFVFTDSCVVNIKKTAHANAPMLAAAPELYEALRWLLEIVCDDCKSEYKVDGKCVKCPRVKAAEAALAKASGESEVRHD